jgi:hypothetical protein
VDRAGLERREPVGIDGSGRNGEREFHGEKRSNATHVSTTDFEAQLYRKGRGKEAKLSFMGHTLMENRNGLIVAATTTKATGTAERKAAEEMIVRHSPGASPSQSTLLTGDHHETEQFNLRAAGCDLDIRRLGGHCHAKRRARQRRFGSEAREGSPAELDTNDPVQSDVCGRRGEGRGGPGCNGSKGEGCSKSEGCNGSETKHRINRGASSLSLPSRKRPRILGQRAAVIGGKEQLSVGASIHADTSRNVNLRCIVAPSGR